MNTEKNKNQTPAKNTFQASAALSAVTSTKSTPKKSKSPLLTVLLFVILAAVIAGGVFLFALNKPGTEIHNAPTATRVPAVVAQNRTATASAQASGTPVPATPGTPGTTTQTANTPGVNVVVPTATIIVVNGQSRQQIEGYGVVTSKVLNLRSAPNTDATVVKSLKTGDIVELVSRNGGWYQTSEGLWISASYMEVRQTRPEAESYARELASS